MQKIERKCNERQKNGQTITALFLHLLVINGVNSRMLYLIGIPIELIIIFWQQVKKYRDRL